MRIEDFIDYPEDTRLIRKSQIGKDTYKDRGHSIAWIWKLLLIVEEGKMRVSKKTEDDLKADDWEIVE